MYIKYGNYQHEANECTVAISQRGLYTEDGSRYGYRDRWEITGRLQAADQSALTSAINAMRIAYATNGHDLGLYTDAGAATSHSIDSSATTTGTMVVEGPDFPEGTGAEYTTFRNYRIVIEAETTGSGGGTLVSYQQTLTYRGTGGPLWAYLPVLVGPPQQQMLQQQSTRWLYQRGRAEQLVTYPAIPGPILPAAEHADQREWTQETLSDGSNRKVSTWSYTMEYL
jgi:hypothetical protein